MNGGDFNTDLGLHTIHTQTKRGNHATVLTLQSLDSLSISFSLCVIIHLSLSVCLSMSTHEQKYLYTCKKVYYGG